MPSSRPLPTIFRALPALALLALLGCGGASGLNPQAEIPAAPLHHGTVDLAQMLVELDALQTPAGANASDFAELKAALRTQLLQGAATKFAAKAPGGTPNIVHDLTSDMTDADEDAISWSYRNAGDYDLNSEVNISDLTPIGLNFHKNTASADWQTARAVDGDGNGEINIADITPIGQNLLNQLSSYRLESSANTDGPWAPVSTFNFADSVPQPGSRLFTYVLPVPRAAYYRVVPADSGAADGVPSDTSRTIQLSPKAEIVGKAGGVQFTSWDGTTLVLTAPTSDPTSIAVGDVVVGDDLAGGFLLNVLTVDQAGTVITITGSQATLADIVIKGTLDLSGAFVPASLGGLKVRPLPTGGKRTSAPYPYSCDCTDQQVHTGGGLDLNIASMNIDFAPDAVVKVNFRDSAVTYFKSELLSDHYKFNAHLVLSNAAFNGTFPANETDRTNYEMTELDVTYKLTSLIDELPAAGQTTLRLFIGVEGQGNFQGNYETTLNSNYTALELGSVYRPSTGWVDIKSYTPSYENPPTPLIAAAGTDIPKLRVYLRGEMIPALYKYVDKNNNPLPLATIGFTPDSDLAATDTTTPSNGYNYVLSGGLTGSLDVDLGVMGLSSINVSRTYDDTPVTVKSGFVPDGGPTGFLLSGTVTEDTNSDGTGDQALPGVTMTLLDSTDTQIAQDVSSADGSYSFSDVAASTNVKVEAALSGYAFNPLSISLLVLGDNPGMDFVGTVSGTDKTFSGNVNDGVNGIPGITVAGGITGQPGILWQDVTDANGDYQLQGISAGLDITVTPDPLGTSVYSFLPQTREFVMVTDVAGADFTGTAVTTWQHTIGLTPPTGADEVISAVSSDSAGNVYVAGYGTVGDVAGPHQGLIAKYDATGVLQWSTEEFPDFSGYVQFNAIAVDSNGVYVVGGTDNINTFNQEILVMKYDSSGNNVWKKSWGIGAVSEGYAAALDASGNLYVGGECDNGGLTGQDAAIIKYDKDGNILWQKSYEVAGTDYVRGGVYDAASGHFLVCGHATNTQPTSSEDITLLKIFNDGSLGVDAMYDIGDLYNASLGVAADGSSNIYVCGSTVAADNQSSQALCLKLAPDGTFLVSSYCADSDPNDSFNQFNAIALDAGHVYAAGYWNDKSVPRLNAEIARYDLSLTHQSSQHYNGSGESRLYSAAVHSLSGDLLLGGYAPDAGGSWTVAGTNLSSPAVFKYAYGGSLVTVSGTVNPPGANPSNSAVTEDSGGGGKDGLTMKRTF